MARQFFTGPQYQNRNPTELNDTAEHAHTVAEQHGKQENLSGTELSRRAAEHNHEAGSQHEHGIAKFGHEDIAALAHALWIQRGSPHGSPEEDWHHAVEILRARSFAH
ncbi:MAG TPA: DUF2934 domain-containing protein [Bryobacteraceae bacterium]|jgi:hypothetical protein|nr:DUF2934 domain-containing protein [Bryobacteraceae bacterium]